ncbi:cytochrome c biogenesis protein CcsA [soil metagenome]
MEVVKSHWWKILAVFLLLYTVIGGFLIDVPRLAILNETIRNQYFHVPMWFSMLILLTASVVFSIKYLRNSNPVSDKFAASFAEMGIVFGILGLLTGMVWARFTWGAWWVNDPKLNCAVIALLIYLAYAVLRNSVEDVQQKARISAVYNIFAFATLIPLLFILPRMTDSLHPGNGGNPGFNIYDLDNKLRLIFYPAVIGWTLMGVWLVSLNIRIKNIKDKIYDVQLNEEAQKAV